MTVPLQYAHAGEIFDRFLVAAMESSGLTTRHQAFTMTEAVLRVFRRRLDVAQALSFADALPAVLRALFVEGWRHDEPRAAFIDRAAMTAEVRALRRHHNLSPDTAISDVARALRAVADGQALDDALARLPEEARAFWRT
jgi:uncharacterized protein (DUF2267 family)